jgi:hypothetical protein
LQFSNGLVGQCRERVDDKPFVPGVGGDHQIHAHRSAVVAGGTNGEPADDEVAGTALVQSDRQ